ncbi:hemopexin repeat-containing protein [Nitrospira sp. Nam74]
MRHYQLLVLCLFIAVSPLAYAGDTLEEYAQKCDAAIGVTVPDFSCDDGTKVPTTHHTNADGSPASYRPQRPCDRPNQLNQECDPGSRFQVLSSDAKSYVVAHCRKQGHAADDGKYKDIAVIQHNLENGATCFYQALAEDLNGKDVKAPSKGIGAWPWKTPAQTAGIGCGGCHDNGAILRSPYLSQVKGADGRPLLPGAGEAYTFNSPGDPYYFVGKDFASWKAYTIEVGGNKCNECHRMGVNNLNLPDAKGTARDFGLRATAATLPNKNPLSAASPMWMLPGQTTHDAAHAAAAQAIKDCADKFKANSPLPNSDACSITQFAGAWKIAAVRWQGNTAYFFKGDRYISYDVKTNTVSAGDPKSIASDWSGLWSGGIDAALMWGNGKAYIFKGPMYVRYDMNAKKVDPGYPKPIAPAWSGVWADGVDAAVPWTNGKVYFFKGDQYIRYDVKADKADAGYPKPIKDSWPGVWEDGIDAAVLWNADKAYFFKGEQYMRYDLKANKVDAGYPKPIKGNWPGVKW